MSTHEVVWDGTRNGRPPYLAVDPGAVRRERPVGALTLMRPSASTEGPKPKAPSPPAAAPLLVEPTPAAPETVKCLKRKADADTEPLKLQVYRLLLLRDAAITDIVAHFKHSHCKSKVYSAMAALRTSGHVVVRRREVRERAKGVGPMMRDVYGPATGRGEL